MGTNASYFVSDTQQGGAGQYGSLCGCVCEDDTCQNCVNGLSKCGCNSDVTMNGNLQKVSVQSKTDWETQQFLYCTGQQPLSIGGIPIQRYGNGQIACDSIVTSFCLNTAETTANPSYAKACACIFEQQRINLMFSGLQFPVQCFASICNDDDPTVYKTTQQSVSCSAKLCEEIISVNGTAISLQGYQTLYCDGETYSVDSTTGGTSPVPTISANFSGPSIHLNATFYVALGLLAIMVLLLTIFGIRKFVLQRKQQQIQKKQITSAIEGLVTQTTNKLTTN